MQHLTERRQQLNAGLWRRLASLCYEALLLTAVLFISGWAFLVVVPGLEPAIRRPLLQLWLLVVSALYFFYCWTHSGQTLPMKTWRMRIMTRSGGVIETRHGIRRYLFALLSIALCGLGWAWAILDRDGQFLHDRLAGTKIVKTED